MLEIRQYFHIYYTLTLAKHDAQRLKALRNALRAARLKKHDYINILRENCQVVALN
jgi:hypothetical protein